jgi:hypothetical protein
MGWSTGAAGWAGPSSVVTWRALFLLYTYTAIETGVEKAVTGNFSGGRG